MAVHNAAGRGRVFHDVRILFMGDVMLGRYTNEVLRKAPPEHPWGDTLAHFRRADLRVCNLECVLSDRGRPWSATPKVFHFRSDARNVAALRAAAIDATSIANNHVLDFEYDALVEMLDVLDGAGIHRAGAGRNRAEAWRPASFVRRGAHAIVFACTDNEEDWEAGAETPGVCYVPTELADPRARRLLEAVAGARGEADCLIVSCHWGGNWSYHPPEEHTVFGRALVDAGADIVFGHSAHVFRGIEIYRGKPILYSTGDFVDDYAVDELERNDESFLFAVDIQDRRVHGLTLYPTLIRECQAHLADPSRGRTIAAKMQSLCRELGTETFWDAGEAALRVRASAPAERAA